MPLPIINPLNDSMGMMPLAKPKKTPNAMAAVTPKAMAIQEKTFTKGDVVLLSLA
jgi:hypothetical protein